VLYSYTAMQVVAAALSNNNLDPVKAAEMVCNLILLTLQWARKLLMIKAILTVSDLRYV